MKHGTAVSLLGANSEPYSTYLLLAVMMLLAVGFACAPLILSAILAPRKPGEIKESTFDSSPHSNEIGRASCRERVCGSV